MTQDNNTLPAQPFDARSEYSKEIAPLIERLIGRCHQLGIPACFMATIGCERDETGLEDFLTTGASTGNLPRMSLQHILACAIADVQFSAWLGQHYARYIGLAVSGEIEPPASGAMDTPLRAAIAAALYRSLVEVGLQSLLSDIATVFSALQTDDAPPLSVTDEGNASFQIETPQLGDAPFTPGE